MPETKSQTIFEKLWPSNDHLFKSKRHRVMAFVDAFPRMSLQVVVAPADGTPGVPAQFFDLEPVQQQKLFAVGSAVGQKILAHSTADERAMLSLEGFAVPDHAHLTYYAGRRGEAVNRYGGQMLSPYLVEYNRLALAFEKNECLALEDQLDRIEAAYED